MGGGEGGREYLCILARFRDGRVAHATAREIVPEPGAEPCTTLAAIVAGMVGESAASIEPPTTMDVRAAGRSAPSW